MDIKKPQPCYSFSQQYRGIVSLNKGAYDVQQNGTLLHTEEEEEDVLSAGPSRKKLHVEDLRHFR